MIWIAIGIEAALGKWMDMSILLAIQMANASIAFYETTKSGDAVAALKVPHPAQRYIQTDNHDSSKKSNLNAGISASGGYGEKRRHLEIHRCGSAGAWGPRPTLHGIRGSPSPPISRTRLRYFGLTVWRYAIL